MLGGMKAVIWTDVVQFVILVGGTLLALILAIQAIPGGFAEAWRLAGDEGKLRLVNTDFDLTQRDVVWTLLIYGIIDFLGSKSVDQINVQRYLIAPNRHATPKWPSSRNPALRSPFGSCCLHSERACLLTINTIHPRS